jgi:hypothetical protein
MIKLKEIELDPIELLLLLPQLLKQGFEENSMSKILLALFIVVILIGVGIYLAQKSLELFASFLEIFKKLGRPIVSGRDQKLAIRRRQQFCGVLRSDLDAIAKAENWNDQWFAE